MNIKICLLVILAFFVFSSPLWAQTALQIVPSSHDFGTQALNTESTQSFTLTAVNGDVMIISAYWETVIPAFYMAPPIPAFTVIYQGDSFPFTIGFMPTNPVFYTNNLILETGIGLRSITVQGTGTASPDIWISPAAFYLSQEEGTIQSNNFNIHNLGSVNLSFAVEDVTVPDWISLSSWSGNIAAGDSLVVTLDTDTNLMALGLNTANIQISSNDPLEPVVNLYVEVDVHAPSVPALEINPLSHEFGSTITPGETGTATFNVTRNPAFVGATSVLDAVVLRGDPAFTLSPDIMNATGAPISLPYALDGTGMAVISVEFEPWDASPQYATLSIYDAMGDSLTVSISAFEATISMGPMISVDPDSVALTLAANSVAGGILTVSNTGDDPLIFSIPAHSTAPEITLFPSSGYIVPGDSTLVQYAVHSSSLTAGTYNRSIAIESNDYGHSPLVIPFTITVNALPEQVDFIGVPLSGHVPLEVQFNDMSIAQGQGWRWDFENDGIIDSYLQNPLYTYSHPGVYTVKLELISPTGAYLERIKPDYVTVTNTPPIVLPGAFTEQEFMEDQVGGPYDLLECFSDPDGDPMSYSVEPSANIWGAATADGMLTLHATANWFGTENISVVAQDPFKGAVTHTFSVTVLPVNDPPQLNVPAHLHFIRNSIFEVDFAQYIQDADNEMAQLSIFVQRLWGQEQISFHYFPTDAPNIPGQFLVRFSSAVQTDYAEGFRITVNDHEDRAIASADFTMHVLEHFNAQLELGGNYMYTGQTVQFRDVTLGNPNYWQWHFGDGQSSTLRHPTHVYAQAGTYDVTLILGHSGAQEEDSIFMPGLITMNGTAVTDDFVPPTWTVLGSPYNLFGDIVIGDDDEVNVEPHVEVNLFGTEPLMITGVLNATQARFRAQNDNGRWGGLRFQGSNQREPSELIDCDIVDAVLPLDIQDASPLISGVTITVSDTTQIEPSRGIRIRGGSSPNLSNVEVINYGEGLLIENDGSDDRDTPTLTNIRVRNSSQTSREDLDSGTGISISGNAEIDSLLVDNFGTAIDIDGSIYNSTPTLTNIRVRNSSQTSRGERLGIRIAGGAAPSLDNVDIADLSYGILIEGAGTPDRDTPTLTNIRVRNSSQTSREENIGIDIAGSVEAHLDDVVVEDYPFGVKYHGALYSRDTLTPTLTNIRVRNSSQTSRNLFIGMQLRDLGRVICTDDSIGGYQIGLEITNSGFTRDVSTPTLTNIRVRNSSQTSRYENAGIFLGSGVAGTLSGADVADARIGIFIADGNTTRLDPARVFNCETGIKAAGSLLPRPLKRHLIVLTPAFEAAHQDWQFKALDISMPGPWIIQNNTIDGYPVYMKASNAGILFDSNIAWNDYPSQQPFLLENTLLNTSYNDIYSSPLYPGLGNMASNPVFYNPMEGDYSLGYDSPCIDAGSPLLPHDADGSRADQGAFPYLHRVSMIVSQRFIQPGTLVSFTNTSLGHDHQDSTCEWDLGKDGIIESQNLDWAHVFNTPGVYNLRLRMTSGLLQDVRDYDAVVVVQSALLQAPQGLVIGLEEYDILLDWEPVTLTQQEIPINVEYYLIYSCDDPDGYFDFVGNTQDYETAFTHVNGALAERRFYFVLGFTGTLRELQQFIDHNRRMKPNQIQSLQMRSKP